MYYMASTTVPKGGDFCGERRPDSRSPATPASSAGTEVQTAGVSWQGPVDSTINRPSNLISMAGLKAKNTMDGLIIEGNRQFVGQTKKALKLLKTRSNLIYKSTVLPYIKKIKLHKTSGMNVFAKMPTYEVANQTAFSSLKWYASTMAHDAYHSKLYFDYKKKHKGQVPRKAFANQKSESRCIKFQIKVAKKIGASAADIKYLKSLDGSHAKLSKINW